MGPTGCPVPISAAVPWEDDCGCRAAYRDSLRAFSPFHRAFPGGLLQHGQNRLPLLDCEVLEEGVDVVARVGIANAGAQDEGLQGGREEDSENLNHVMRVFGFQLSCAAP